jgi:DNA-binding XRE family transcriptional regulator
MKYIELLSKGNKTHMAKDMKVSRQTIYDWIAKKYAPNHKQLVTMADYFKVTVEEIV